jgi:hypothetical protein
MQALDHGSATRRSGHKTLKSTRAACAGSLRGDLATVAMKLHEALHRSDITVWTNADSEVLFCQSESTPEIGSEWLAGTYGIGASVNDIAADLDVLRCECIPAAILD